MSEIPLNKFEKEKRVIQLHLEGKTIRDISKEVHMSFGFISKIIKAYDKKIRLQDKKKRT
jgi:transposase